MQLTCKQIHQWVASNLFLKFKHPNVIIYCIFPLWALKLSAFNTCMFCCWLKTNTNGKILIWSLRSDFCPSNSVCVCIKKTLVNIYYIFVPIKLIIKNYFLVIETLDVFREENFCIKTMFSCIIIWENILNLEVDIFVCFKKRNIH